MISPERWLRRVFLVAGILLVGGGLAYFAWVDRWPVKVEFRDAWPLTFTPDGRSYVLFNPGRITFRDCGTGREQFSWSLPDSSSTVVVAGAFSPDGRTFAAALRQNNTPAEVALIDVASGQIRATGRARHEQVYGFGYTSDGSAVRMGTADRTGFRELVSFDASTAALEFVFPPNHPSPGHKLAGSADGRFLVDIPPDGGPILLHEVGPPANCPKPMTIGLTSVGALGGAGFAPDGRTLAIGRLDGSIDLWDIPGRRQVRTLQAHAGGHSASWILFAPDGRTIASQSLDFTPPNFDLLRMLHNQSRHLVGLGVPLEPPDLVIFDCATGKPLIRSSHAVALAYSPDGRTVATRLGGEGPIQLRVVPEP